MIVPYIRTSQMGIMMHHLSVCISFIIWCNHDWGVRIDFFTGNHIVKENTALAAPPHCSFSSTFCTVLAGYRFAIFITSTLDVCSNACVTALENHKMSIGTIFVKALWFPLWCVSCCWECTLDDRYILWQL